MFEVLKLNTFTSCNLQKILLKYYSNDQNSNGILDLLKGTKNTYIASLAKDFNSLIFGKTRLNQLKFVTIISEVMHFPNLQY